MMNLFDIDKPYLKFSKSRDKVRWFSTFSGVGMQEMGLKRITSNYEILGFSEIDKHAINSYHAIHDQGIKNYGDIMNIRGGSLPKNIDFFTYSFPCTDVSKAGQQKGLSSETRSGLVFEVLRLLDELKSLDNLPKVLLMENVPMLLAQKFKDGWHKIYNEIEALGYSNFVAVLNSDDYGVAQTRDRVFMVSILGDYQYQFPNKFELEKQLLDYLEPNVNEKYYLTDAQIEQINNWNSQRNPIKEAKSIYDKKSFTITAKSNTTMNASMLLIREPLDGEVGGVIIPEATKKGYAIAEEGDGVYIDRPHQKRGVVQKGKIQTLKTNPNDVGVVVKVNKMAQMINQDGNVKRYIGSDVVDEFAPGDVADLSFPNGYNKGNRVFKSKAPSLTVTTIQNLVAKEESYRIRKLTPLECWRLMDISDEDFYKAKESGMSDTQLYKQAGNGIVVSVVERILRGLFDE